MRRPCSIPGCERPSSSRGWCVKHYSRWRRSGDAAEPRPPAVTLPLQPLLDRLGVVAATTAQDRLGVGPGRVLRWGSEGLSVDEADEMAGRLKLHPFDIWGASWNEAEAVQVEADEAYLLATQGQECEAPDCTNVFLPTRPSARRRFCSTRCQARIQWRTRAKKMPEERKEAKRAYARQYRADVRAAELRRRTRECESSDCTTRFVAERGDQRFCCPTCRNREKMRRARRPVELRVAA